MFKKHPLLSALLISVIWHLFWMLAVTIIIVPENFGLTEFSSISFLGPILDNVGFNSTEEVTLTQSSTSIHEKELYYPEEVGLEIEHYPQRATLLDSIESQSQAERISDIEESSQVKKITPRHNNIPKDLSPQAGLPVTQKDSVDYKPSELDYPDWAEKKFLDSDFEIEPPYPLTENNKI